MSKTKMFCVPNNAFRILRERGTASVIAHFQWYNKS